MANVPDGTIDVSAGAQSAIKNAMSSLEAYKNEPRVAALIAKLGAIASPEDFSGDDEAQLAKAMTDCERIAKSEGVAEPLRKRAGDSLLELQRGYLSRVSPAGSAVWEESARAAGRAA